VRLCICSLLINAERVEWPSKQTSLPLYSHGGDTSVTVYTHTLCAQISLRLRELA